MIDSTTETSSAPRPLPPDSKPARRRAYWIIGGVLAAVIGFGSVFGRHEVSREAEREAPVNAPSRLQRVSTPDGEETAVVLDSATEARIGIGAVTVGAATRVGGTLKLTGELIADPARVTTVRAAVPGRLNAIGPWPAIGEELQAGRDLAQVSDAQPLAVPRAGVVTRVSAQPGELVQAGQELVQLTDFREPLARVVWRFDVPLDPPPTVRIAPFGTSGTGALARYIAPAAEVDTLTRAPAFLYRVSKGWLGARPGLPIVATIADPRSTAVGRFVPTDAVVQWDALSWVYVQRDVPGASGAPAAHTYVRRRVDTSRPVDGGWLAPSTPPRGLRTGDRIVIRGAQQLLSEEFRARIQVGEEPGK